MADKNIFQVKRTSTSGRAPNTTSTSNSSYIAAGEFALNMADKILYTSDGSNLIPVGGNVATLRVGAIIANNTLGTAGQVLTTNSSGVYWADFSGGGGGGIGTGAITVRSVNGRYGAVNTHVTDVTAINFDESTGIHVTDQGSGNVFVSLGSSFKTIQVSGQNSLVALGEDTLTLVAGPGIDIYTNNTAPKTLTIASTGGTTGIFDGGNPFSSYSSEPVLDAGGVY
jgi:hypothetical protein